MSLPLTFVVPGDINTRTGGYRYDKRIIDGLKDSGTAVQLVSLEGDYPFPSEQQKVQASAQFEQIPDNTHTIVDGLAFSAIPEIIAQHSDRLNFTALIHHPLALETGLSAADASVLEAREKEALSFARKVITTSKFTADTLLNYQVSANKLFPILPGTDPAPASPYADSPPWNLLCVATITARKGHEILIQALATLTDYNWQLTCAGSTQRDPDTYSQLLTSINNLNLTSRIHFAGEVDDEHLSTLYQQTDLAVLASWYEGYGMVLDEAVSRALPIVCTRGGAIQHTVPDGAGLLVNPGDAEGLARAIETFFSDTHCRQRLRDAATRAREQQRSWPKAIAEFGTVLAS